MFARSLLFVTLLLFTPSLLSAQIELTDRNGDGEIKAVAIGDSITLGVGDGVPSNVVVEMAPIISGALGYPGRVENFLGILVDNRGVAGELITDGVDSRFAAQLTSSRADYVFIMEGSNDAIFRIDSAVYRAALQKLINISRTLNVEPILMTLPLTCCDRESLIPFLRSYSREVRELASVNEISFADIELAFDQSCPSRANCSLLNRPEGLHPNTEGYDLIGKVLTETITGEPIPVEGEPEGEETEMEEE